MTRHTPSRVGWLLAGTAFLACTLSLHAQPPAPPPSFQASLSWDEVTIGTHTRVPNPNGQLDPGEAALFRFTLAFTPEVGQMTTYQMLSGAFATWPVAGLSAVNFGVTTTQANGGAWIMQPSIPGFQSQIWAFEPETGSILASAGQPDPSLGAFPLPTNPLPSLWSAIWTPPDFMPRTAAFDFRSGTSSGGLFVHTGTTANGHPTFGSASVAGQNFGVLHIPIAPAPASCLLFPAFVCLASRPTRRNY